MQQWLQLRVPGLLRVEGLRPGVVDGASAAWSQLVKLHLEVSFFACTGYGSD